jgi:large subunit ribosomal protein L9
MEVVLLQDVTPLGAQGTVVQVKPGFARNYLLPRGLAAEATPLHLKRVEELAQSRARKAERLKTQALALKRAMEARSLTLKLTVGESDKPFGSISAHDLAEALREAGLAVEKSAIQLEQPIKTLGVFEVPVRVHPDVSATVKLWVVKA